MLNPYFFFQLFLWRHAKNFLKKNFFFVFSNTKVATLCATCTVTGYPCFLYIVQETIKVVQYSYVIDVWAYCRYDLGRIKLRSFTLSY